MKLAPDMYFHVNIFQVTEQIEIQGTVPNGASLSLFFISAPMLYFDHFTSRFVE